MEISQEADSVYIRDPQTQLRLRVWQKPNDPALDVHFVDRNRVITTGRNFDEYRRLFPGLNIRYGDQVIEFGGGLSELSTLVADMHDKRRPDKKPIIIDPAQYPLMRNMLEFSLENAKTLELLHGKRARLEELLRRCDIILNPEKVRLVNATVGKAGEQFPDLRRIADIGIDAYGPLHYMRTEFPALTSTVDEIRSAMNELVLLEKSFIKDQGIFLEA